MFRHRVRIKYGKKEKKNDVILRGQPINFDIFKFVIVKEKKRDFEMFDYKLIACNLSINIFLF